MNVLVFGVDLLIAVFSSINCFLFTFTKTAITKIIVPFLSHMPLIFEFSYFESKLCFKVIKFCFYKGLWFNCVSPDTKFVIEKELDWETTSN
jgi:hypothetical protein